MVDLLVATVTFTVLVAVLLVLLVAVSVLPIFLALQMAESRRFSSARWFVLSTAAVLVGLAGAYRLHQNAHRSWLLTALPLLLTWSAPVALWLLDAKQARVGGRSGRHE